MGKEKVLGIEKYINFFRSSVLTVCLAAMAFCLPALAQAATLTVPAQYPTIQAAINAAQNGDTVLTTGKFWNALTVTRNPIIMTLMIKTRNYGKVMMHMPRQRTQKDISMNMQMVINRFCCSWASGGHTSHIIMHLKNW